MFYHKPTKGKNKACSLLSFQSSADLLVSQGVGHGFIDGIIVLPFGTQAGVKQHIILGMGTPVQDVLLVKAQPECVCVCVCARARMHIRGASPCAAVQ
eukprot:1138531-Pelagomonas_calceolata.AAC.7